jgi:hypothetical protein
MKNETIQRAIAFLLFGMNLMTVSRAQIPVADASATAAVQNTLAGIEFKTVAAALEKIRAKPGVAISVTTPDSWIIVSESGGMVVWSFAPATHPAYPAVVRRAIVVGPDGVLRIETSGLCEAEQAPCDKLMSEFREMNAKAQQAIQRRIKAQ